MNQLTMLSGQSSTKLTWRTYSTLGCNFEKIIASTITINIMVSLKLFKV